MPTLELAIDARRARLGASQFNSAAGSVTKSATGASGAVTRFNTAVGGVGAAARRATAPLTGLVAGFAGIAAASSAIRTIVDFEQTIATLQTVTQATTADLDRLEATARQLGATTRFSATEAGEGLVFLARAGFDANQAIAALPSTLDLATNGAIELGEAADFASNILSAFQLDASETERVVDTLVNTANSANTDVRQLAEALKFAAPIAGNLGITVEETAAAIGVLGDVGIQASLAGTNLRGIIAGLLGPTSGAQKVLAELGLTLEDIDPTTRSLTDIFKAFNRIHNTSGPLHEVVSKFCRLVPEGEQVVAIDATNNTNRVTKRPGRRVVFITVRVVRGGEFKRYAGVVGRDGVPFLRRCPLTLQGERVS